MTDQEIDDLRKRNAIRLQEVKDRMGAKWLLHPENQMTKEKWKKVVKTTNKSLSQ